MHRVLMLAVMALGISVLAGCPIPPTSPDGLVETDFKPISENGFDAADNATDLNDYAWSMKYFLPDGADEGFLYVGTGNGLIELVYQVIDRFLGGEGNDAIPTLPPEIRRYRPDISNTTWEKVFDIKDVETPPTTTGFRIMECYRAQSNGVNYLYAGTMATGEISVWRTADGTSWEKVYTTAGPGSVRSMVVHNGILYFGLANDLANNGQPGKIIATDGATFWTVNGDGFGNPDNSGIMALASFNGYLYAGTANLITGFEIWKLEGADGKILPAAELVIDQGGTSPDNQWAGTAKEFDGYLYWGTQSNPIGNLVNQKGADIIRLDTDDTMEVIVGPDSLSGFESGFGHWPNGYIWAFEEHEGWFYASTYDQVSAFFNMLENVPAFLEVVFNKHEANPIEELTNAGGDLYKTQDGINWYPVTVDGMEDVGNYGFRTMVSLDRQFFIGTANPFDGLEMWVGQDY